MMHCHAQRGGKPWPTCAVCKGQGSADLTRGWPKKQEEVKDTALSNPIGAGAITFFADIHKHLSSIEPEDSTETQH